MGDMKTGLELCDDYGVVCRLVSAINSLKPLLDNYLQACFQEFGIESPCVDVLERQLNYTYK